jgi:predicted RNA-binding protein YlxR (DUF448 family)
MIRVVRRADGSVAVDHTGKAPGRGTYLCDQAACREPTSLANAIQRALGASIEAEQILVEVTHASP